MWVHLASEYSQILPPPYTFTSRGSQVLPLDEEDAYFWSPPSGANLLTLTVCEFSTLLFNHMISRPKDPRLLYQSFPILLALLGQAGHHQRQIVAYYASWSRMWRSVTLEHVLMDLLNPIGGSIVNPRGTKHHANSQQSAAARRFGAQQRRLGVHYSLTRNPRIN